jgi:hypothetical protein
MDKEKAVHFSFRRENKTKQKTDRKFTDVPLPKMFEATTPKFLRDKYAIVGVGGSTPYYFNFAIAASAVVRRFAAFV